MRYAIVAGLLALAMPWTSVQAAAATPHCPLRTERYSIDSPLMDILLKPEAKAAVARELPGLLAGVGSIPGGTQAPSLTAIMSLRTVAAFKSVSAPDLLRVDRVLRKLPVTSFDQQARCARYDEDPSPLKLPSGRLRLLLFEKMTGFRDGPSVAAARTAFQAMAARRGWALVVSDKGGAITPANLKQFDAVIWNNVSGDVLTLRQRRAFADYVKSGGGYVGVHGSAGDYIYPWRWYADTLIGARFIGHPMGPQFQDARIMLEPGKSGIGGDIAPGWVMKDEWYSFRASPRRNGARVIAALDEESYSPRGIGNLNLRMGDHPIAWTRCVGAGRSFYSAIGHRPETYSDPSYAKLLESAILWAAGKGATRCHNGREVGS